MKIYGIGHIANHCAGHGDYYTDIQMSPQGAYGSGDFHPFFKQRREAEEYINGLQFHESLRVVECELKD